MSLLPPLLAQVEKLGFKAFTKGAYNLNIIGIRSKQRVANEFDDLMCCVYRESKDGPFIAKYWPCTTDPGTYWLENPMRVDGTAIMAPGQYRGAYRLDLHAGKYEALCQREAPIKVFRDSNRDEILDMEPDSLAEGFFGCNIHKAGKHSTQVNKWSAGCQVLREGDFYELMALVYKQIEHHPTWTKFTYTLIEEW